MHRIFMSPVAALAATVAAFIATAAPAQEFPSRPIRIVIPFAAGGPTDILARLMAPKLTERWGQQIIVDNRPGAGATLGADIAARATPDGYTLLFNTVGHSITPFLFPKLGYDAVKSFAPITAVSQAPLVLVMNPSVPAKTVADIVALAKAKPGQVAYGSSGNGGISHLAGHLFTKSAGITMNHIPYKGMGPVIPDLIAGQVSLAFPDPLVAMPHVRAGRLRLMAVTSSKRSVIDRDVPTIAESGLPGYDVAVWYGMFAPAGTPPAVLERLHAGLVAVVNAPDLKERIIREGGEPLGNSPAAFAAMVKADLDKWGVVVKDSGAKSE
jgi:tripartite-type tricarboxylate transporter receptor subunit TctC